MSCEGDRIVVAEGLGKCYRIYDKPHHRLLEGMVRGRRHYHKDFWALSDLSLTISRGETLALIGLNGSGKSTALQLLTGTVAPTTGSMCVSGRVSALLELGAGFNPEFTGRENIFMNGAILGLTRDQIHSRLDSIIAFADIGDFIDQPVRTYSSGMYVRLGFAVAIHTDPDVLVVDEALAVGDFMFQQKCNLFMQREMVGVAKLLVTHDMGAVARLADRVIVLDHGRIAYEGGPLNAIEEYQKLARGGSGQRPARGLKAEGIVPASAPDVHWETVPPTRLSGELHTRIEAVAVGVDGDWHARSVQPGQVVACRLRLRVESALAEPIIGVNIQDRFGTVLFGENSVSVGALPRFEPGLVEASFRLTWPTIAPAKYSLTFGVGDGRDALGHVIECWAHNVVVVDHAHDLPVHGLFNVPITDLMVQEAQ